MTKSITVARQQASNFAEKKYTVGLDLAGLKVRSAGKLANGDSAT